MKAGAGVELALEGNGPTFRVTRADDPQFSQNVVVLDPVAPGPTFTDASPGPGTVFYDLQ